MVHHTVWGSRDLLKPWTTNIRAIYLSPDIASSHPVGGTPSVSPIVQSPTDNVVPTRRNRFGVVGETISDEYPTSTGLTVSSSVATSVVKPIPCTLVWG